MPRVFVSYSQDSEQHNRSVLLLTQSLRALGVEARIDALFIHEATELWRWMQLERDCADFILVVCSQGYFDKSSPDAQLDRGTGVGWEAAEMMRELYEAPASARAKYIPVLLDDTSQETIPAVLRVALHYRVEFHTAPAQSLTVSRLLEELSEQPGSTAMRRITAEVQPLILELPGMETLWRKVTNSPPVLPVPVLESPSRGSSAFGTQSRPHPNPEERASAVLPSPESVPVSRAPPRSTHTLASQALTEDFGVRDIFLGRGSRLASEYAVRLENAKESIDLLGMGERYARTSFGSSLVPLSRRGIRIRVLLLDPGFPSGAVSVADLRDTEEGDPGGSIRSDIHDFEALVREAAVDIHYLDVRLYAALPTVSITRIDDDLFWGPYLFGERSRDSPTTLVRRGGLLFDQMQRHYEELWNLSNALR